MGAATCTRMIAGATAVLEGGNAVLEGGNVVLEGGGGIDRVCRAEMVGLGLAA